MKNRIAAALSLTGVLVAGSAAALVNTQVLRSDNNSGGSALTVADLATPTSLASTPAAGSIVAVDFAGQPLATAAPVDTTLSSAPPTAPTADTTATSMAAATSGASAAAMAAGEPADTSGTQATYRLGDAGTVTLGTSGEVLTVVASAPNPGWTVLKIEQDEPHAVDIRFRSATTELTFRAHLLYGVVSTSVETRTISAPPAGTVPGVTTPSVPGDPSGEMEDDDQDDEQHDDDHDDGHESEEGDDD